MLHYVSNVDITRHASRQAGRLYLATVSLGYQVNKNTEVSVGVFNALHDVHRENPAGDEIGTGVMGTVAIKF